MRGAVRWINGRAPVQGAQLTKLVGQSFPTLTAVGTAKQLAEVGVGEQKFVVMRVHRHRPGRTDEHTRKREGLPGVAIIGAAPELACVAGWAVAICQKNDRIVVRADDDAARVLPRRIECDERPVLTVVQAAMQAAVGGRVQDFVALFIVHDGNAVHVG